MSLRGIVRALGGDLYDGGRRANIPAPGHSAQDRSVSLLLQDDRVVVHTFGDGDWKAVLDQLREHQLIDAPNAPLSIGPGPPAVGRPGPRGSVRRASAGRGAAAVGGRPGRLGPSLSARHCRLRGWPARPPRAAGPAPPPRGPRLGLSPGTAIAGRRCWPASRTPDGRYIAVEVTYLAPNGRRAVDLRLPRKTVGPPPAGCAVRLDPADARDAGRRGRVHHAVGQRSGSACPAGR